MAARVTAERSVAVPGRAPMPVRQPARRRVTAPRETPSRPLPRRAVEARESTPGPTRYTVVHAPPGGEVQVQPPPRFATVPGRLTPMPLEPIERAETWVIPDRFAVVPGRAEPMPLAPVERGIVVPVAGAIEVGIIAAGGTSLTMIPADLTIGPRTDITEFTIVSLNAGSY